MVPRRKLDIGWSDLVFGFCQTFIGGDERELARRIAAHWTGRPSLACLACLSVRSGLDLVLQALRLPHGSEVLVSALTIGDMVRVIEHHGLVARPVDIDPATLAPPAGAVEAAIGPRTRAILVAHLFGSRMPLADIARTAQAHRLLLIEDCAQAFAADGYTGNPATDVAMFSFGPIKTATALGGAVLFFRDASLATAVSGLQASLPRQKAGEFRGRVLRFALLKLLSVDSIYGLFVLGCRTAGRSHDAIVSAAVRGFPGSDLITRLRRRPGAALLALLARRLERYSEGEIGARTAVARRAIGLMPGVRRPGAQAPAHTHWVFPVFAGAGESAEQLARRLWCAGFDATHGGSSMTCVCAPAGSPRAANAEAIMKQIVFLPVHPALDDTALQRLSSLLAAPAGNTNDNDAPASTNHPAHD